MRYIDLHTHSSCSDGTLSPGLLVLEAQQAGLAAIALTDHDTMAGVSEALAAGVKIGVEVLPGVEISANHDGRAVHILGYGLDHQHPALKDLLEQLQKIREERNSSILEKLTGQGIDLDLVKLNNSAEGLIGRPHIARMLVRQGHAGSINQAFKKFLKKNGRAYVAAARFPAVETIRVIKDAGGLAVLAHPSSIDQTLARIPALARALTYHGLDGLEAFYPGHGSKTCKTLCDLAKKLGLLITGGSDFHGAMKPGINLGGSPVMPPIPYRLLEDLQARLGSNREKG